VKLKTRVGNEKIFTRCFIRIIHQGNISRLDPSLWTRGGGIPVPCGPSGHVDPEREYHEIGCNVQRGVKNVKW